MDSETVAPLDEWLIVTYFFLMVMLSGYLVVAGDKKVGNVVAWRNFAGTMKVERRTLIVLASKSYVLLKKWSVIKEFFPNGRLVYNF